MNVQRPIRGFSLVETLIILVIIGLLTAIAIPAYVRVKFQSIHNAIASHTKILAEQRTWYQAVARDHPNWANEGKNGSASAQEESVPETPTPFAPITIKGKTYVLIPQQNAEETTIAGQRYWIIPAP